MKYRSIFIFGFFVIILVFGVLYFIYSLLKNQRRWKTKLKNQPSYRMLKSEKDFVDFYLSLGYKKDSIDFVYRHTQGFLKAEDLVLLHTDDLLNLYEINEDEWFWVLNKWRKELGYNELSRSDFNERRSNSPLDFEFLIKMI